MTEIRRLLADLVCQRDIKIKTDLMGDRRQMQHGIGGTSERHIHGQRIQHSFLSHDISRADVPF